MREIEIRLVSASNRKTERIIDHAIADSGLNVTLRATLRKFPGCIHWHVKRGKESGTLEITFWPQERRAWFTIQDSRTAEWIEEGMGLIMTALQRQTDAGAI
jgi:hypothetical protein